MGNWSILGIEETKDKEKIKEAYMNKLTEVNPEDNPEGFKSLRRAYEEVLELADEIDEPEDDSSELGIWTKKVTNTYNTFSKRINEDSWKEILDDEICIGLDTRDEACNALLKFLMDYYYLPHNIWNLLDSYLDLKERKEELYESFPYQFIDYVIYNIDYPSSLKYDLFEINDEKDYETWIRLYYKIRQDINNREMEKVETSLKEIEDLDIYHPYLNVLKVRYLIINDNTIDARKICTPLLEKYPNDISIVYCMAEIEWTEKNIDEAGIYYEKCLEILPNDFNSMTGLADVYLEQEKLDEAKDMYIELIRRSRYDNYIRNKMIEVNDKLIEKYKVEIEENLEDISKKFRLAWCCYENYKYDECISVAKMIEPKEREDKRQCYDLLGRAFSALGKYSEAFEFFDKWIEDEEKTINDEIEENKAELTENNDEDKESERKGRLSYVYYQKGKQLFYLNRYEESIECFNKSIEKCNNDISSLDYKANALNRLGRFEESLEVSEKALSLDDSQATIYVNKAEALYELGYYRDSMEACDYAISIYQYFSKPYLIKMKIYFEYDEFEKMIDIANEFEQFQIDDNDIKLYKAKALRNLDKVCEAEDICKKIIETYKDENGDFNIENANNKVYYELALVECDKNDLDEAIKYLNLSLKINSNDLDNYYLRGYIYRKKGEFDLALKDYDFTIKNSSKNEFSYLKKAEIFEEKNELNLAIKFYKKVLELNPEHPTANNSLGEIYENQNDDDTALEYFTRQIEIDPSEYQYIHRGILHSRNNRMEESKSDYEEALRINPNSTFAYNNIGCLYKNICEYEKAIYYFKKSINVIEDTDFVNPFNNIARCYIELKDNEMALKYYNIGIEKIPNEDSLYYNKAKLYRRMKLYEESIDSYKQGLKIENIDKEDYYDEIGDVYRAMKDYKKALDWYEKIVSINPKHSFVYRSMGYVYEEINEYDKAIKCFLKQIKVDGGKPINYLSIADTYSKMGKKLSAIMNYKKSLRKFLASNSMTAYVLNNIGCCYKGLNKYKEALLYLNKSIEAKVCGNCEFCQCHESYFTCGEIYEENKNYKEALINYKKALEINESEDKYLEAVKRVEKLA